MSEIFETCFLCGSKFQMGPHRYDGTWNKTYRMSTCGSCHKMSSDGWSPRHETAIIEHLEEHGLPIPARNANGLLPRE